MALYHDYFLSLISALVIFRAQEYLSEYFYAGSDTSTDNKYQVKQVMIRGYKSIIRAPQKVIPVAHDRDLFT